jgi:hypothetical protein
MPTPVSVAGNYGLPGNHPAVPWMRKVQQSANQLGSLWAYEIVVATTGAAHEIPVSTGTCLLTPAGAISGVTLTLPAQASDGFRQSILSSQTVTGLTVSPGSGQTIVGTASFTLAAGSEAVFMFVADTSTWYRAQ